ncbi:hypothetical protein P171DRAFT_482705 [Karstenula rhodostoma CBS 690.94]|uniref:Uncharacterized protein n=1 Tax=Karstenula rhodostoma CBS 690.94 TaxID=1392251 RepID=A0A9P4UFZ6_9PLEO|nr:hypothetical protein P171DRAFT_482705 [Karstenula rhodostoma CBS 690.94]
MDRNLPSGEVAFNRLSIELNKTIAHCLSDHKDIATFNAICRGTSDAIVGDNLSFWRAKFCEDFARPPNKTNEQLCRLYKERWSMLRRFVNMKTHPKYQFVRGYTLTEKAIVKIVTDLINESFAGSAQSDGNRPRCENMLRLKQFVLESRLLLGGRRPPPPSKDEPVSVSVSLAAVRLMATHFLFDQAIHPGSWFAIDDTQRAVYAATNETPLYLGPEKNIVNMEWILQCLNFFRYYMTDSQASDLHDAMQELDESQRPSVWEGPLKSGSYPLGNYWKGTYAFLEHKDLTRFRKLVRLDIHTDHIFTDLNIDEGNIQSLYLDFPKDASALHWPAIFEDHLHSLRESEPAQARAQHSKKSTPAASNEPSSIRFDGHGEDLEDLFYASGWLNALPPQADIPGWQRITFMKHFEDDLEFVNRDNLWAYEGVVLPGGKIILGRWWFASSDDEVVDLDNEYGGPFIFWAVEPEDQVQNGDEE